MHFQEIIVYIILSAVAVVIIRYIYRQLTGKGTACHCDACPKHGGKCHCERTQK